MTGNLFSGIFFTSYCHFNFFTSLFVLSGYRPSSALDIVLLVLEHPSIFLAAAICTVSSCFTNFAFPSYTTPAYPHFGTIILMKVHISILVSRCESVEIASILPTCDLPFPITFATVYPKSSPLRSLRQGTYTGLRSLVHLLPACI